MGKNWKPADKILFKQNKSRNIKKISVNFSAEASSLQLLKKFLSQVPRFQVLISFIILHVYKKCSSKIIKLLV